MPPHLPHVLMVSKAVEPPWNDSSKNLVRDLVSGLTRVQPVVMTRDPSRAPSEAIARKVYGEGGSTFAPALLEHTRTLWALATDRSALWHFFFAPNARTARVGQLSAQLKRRKTVHTVCSAPHPAADLDRALFADVTVVLSHATHARLEEAVARRGGALARIPPAVPPLLPLTEQTRAQVRAKHALGDAPFVLFAGDLCTGGGVARCLDALDALPKELQLVIAARDKSARSAEVRRALQARAARFGDRVRWLGETSEILQVVGAADVLALPVDSLYAKMDYPLVLLEAMAMGVPVVVGSGTPAEELGAYGAWVTPLNAVDRGAEKTVEREALAQAITEAIARGLGSGEEIRTTFSALGMAKAYESIYAELLA